MSGQQRAGEIDAYEQAIAACNGDLHATIKALLIANAYLEAELDSVTQSVSKGYARGRVRQREGR